jgi:hypothetical protein
VTIQYFVKAIYAATAAFLSAVAVVLVDDATFGDISQGQWVVIAGFTLAAFGGILGFQNAPSTVATSVKE